MNRLTKNFKFGYLCSASIFRNVNNIVYRAFHCANHHIAPYRYANHLFRVHCHWNVYRLFRTQFFHFPNLLPIFFIFAISVSMVSICKFPVFNCFTFSTLFMIVSNGKIDHAGNENKTKYEEWHVKPQILKKSVRKIK